MEQMDIWNFELAINNLLFEKDKKDDGLVSLTTMYVSNKEIFDKFINELLIIKEAGKKLQESSSKQEILDTIKKVKQNFEDIQMQNFENKKELGPLALKKEDRKQPNRFIKSRERELEKERERELERERKSGIKNRPDNTHMQKNGENPLFLNKENLQLEYGPIKTYKDFKELDKDMIEMFCCTDKRLDVAFNIFILVEESNGKFKFVDIAAERYKTNNNAEFLGKECAEVIKTLNLSKIETIKTDKVFFSLKDNFHNSPNAFKRCLKLIAEYISNERLGIFKESSEFKYIVVHTQEKRLMLYRLIASLNDINK